MFFPLSVLAVFEKLRPAHCVRGDSGRDRDVILHAAEVDHAAWRKRSVGDVAASSWRWEEGENTEIDLLEKGMPSCAAVRAFCRSPQREVRSLRLPRECGRGFRRALSFRSASSHDFGHFSASFLPGCPGMKVRFGQNNELSCSNEPLFLQCGRSGC